MPKYMVLLVLALVLSLSLSTCKKDDDEKPAGANLEASISWLGRRPQQNIRKFSVISQFLSQHHVYISLTTSPTRIKYVPTMLKTLDLTNITAILVNLPERFGRDNTPYTIPPELEAFPKVVINRIPTDLGPITKLVPGIAYARRHDAAGEDLLITVDDDIGYPWGMVNEIIKQLVFSNATVVGSCTENLSKWKLEGTAWPSSPGEDVVEGYGGIGYRVKDVATDLMLEIGAAMKKELQDPSCYLSDDLVISFVLGKAGIRLVEIDNRYVNRGLLITFAYGEEDDALHKGGGNKELKKAASDVDVNRAKYERCWNYIQKKFLPKN